MCMLSSAIHPTTLGVCFLTRLSLNYNFLNQRTNVVKYPAITNATNINVLETGVNSVSIIDNKTNNNVLIKRLIFVYVPIIYPFKICYM